MKVYNERTVTMTPSLNEKLQEYRTERAFNPQKWIEYKAQLINDYFTISGLNTAVIGVSGGLDSAVSLSLIKYASALENSPLKKIVPMLLPALSQDGATNQDECTARGEELCKSLDLKPHVFTKLTEVTEMITGELETILGIKSTPWSRGQLVAYARTPILYNTCSTLTAHGYPALVIGTINLSEGGYLGYIGKASDALVDLQIISDLYKSEVYTIGKLLGVNNSILTTVPNGDMYDGRDDETVFGASYDFVELYHYWLQDNKPAELLNDETFLQGQANLEHLHSYNAHKYLYSTPSIHLDIMPASIPEGWNNTPWRS